MRLQLCLLFASQQLFAQVTLSGYVMETGSREIIPYANIRVGETSGTASNAFGFYSITLPAGQQTQISFSSIGYVTFTNSFLPAGDSTLNIFLTARTTELDEVVITAGPEPMMQGLGHAQISLQLVEVAPMLLGEKDVMKTIQLLPGIQRGAEGSVALFVRGGSPDQNLIILDDAQVYNVSHLFGFVSVFNGDALKSVQFWKGAFPARYGGRISSVIDLQMKDGSKEKFKGEGGIGILSSRLTLEGPIKKNKSSFLISARRSYLDLLVKPFLPKNQKVGYRLHDINAKLNFELDEKNKIFVSAYVGNDKLAYNEKVERTTYDLLAKDNIGWGNETATTRWNHAFGKKLFSNTTLLFSHFRFFLNDKIVRTGQNPRDEYTAYQSSIRDFSWKNDFDYFVSNRHTIKTGIQLTHHLYKPKAFTFRNAIGDESENVREQYANVEAGLYAEDMMTLGSSVKIHSGLRANFLNTDYKNFSFLEPRLTVGWDLPHQITLSGSYARANQFVHLLSNTGIGLATDLWVPATLKAPPQQSDQFAAGLLKTFAKSDIRISVETYRKYMRNILSYAEGAKFLDISEGYSEFDWQENITRGSGLSYGTEFMIQKSRGKFTGLIGYTLAWITHRFDSLNGGKTFFPRYDSRHNVTTTLAYRFSPKVLVSMNWIYGTGNALTVPQSFYHTNIYGLSQDAYYTSVVPYFGSRNSFRAEAYHRLDVAVQLFRKRARFERYWEFGVFNAYNRKNPFYYYLQGQNGQAGTFYDLKKRALFPLLPSVTYNFKF